MPPVPHLSSTLPGNYPHKGLFSAFSTLTSTETAMRTIDLSERKPIKRGNGWRLYPSVPSDLELLSSDYGVSGGQSICLVHRPALAPMWLVSASLTNGVFLMRSLIKLQKGFKFVEIDHSALEAVCAGVEKSVNAYYSRASQLERIWAENRLAAIKRAALPPTLDLFGSPVENPTARPKMMAAV
jgi:hypothetical protein